MRKSFLTWTVSLVLFASLTSCEILDQIMKSVPANVDPSETEIIGGLKEALANGAAQAVTILSKEGGYYNDPLVRIPFPQEVRQVEKTLRDIGAGQLVDDFLLRLNKGAEEGAKAALPIFKDAILSMSIADAKNILFGSDTAATAYFRAKTSEQLYQAFSPQIRTSLDQVGAAKAWTDVTSRYNKIPLVKKVETDLVRYATNKALDGLFLKLADEEKRIRENPIARTTELLKKVFSYADRQKAGGQ